MVRGPPMFGMRRREFITLLGGAVAAWPLAARAQQPAMPVIGFMSTRSPEDSAYLLAAFRRGLAEGGFVEGQNVAIEFRWARGRYDLLSAMAAELVSRRVAVLTTAGGEPSALAAKRATSTIPMVFGIGGDPVALGVVESFSRPVGNATGVTLLTSLMEPKRLGLLRDLVPGVPLIGVLLNPEFAPASHYLQEVEEAARSIDQRILIANASTDEELETAFAALISAHVGALLVTADPYFDTRREQIVAFCGPAAPALHLPVSRIRGRGRIAELWREHHRCLSQLRRLYREDSQRRKTRRSTGAAADQVRDGNQSQDRRGARHQNLRQSTLARRRGHRMIRRREFITLIGGAAATAWPLAARGQEPGRIYRLGSLHTAPRDAPHHVALLDDLRRLGFAEGQNLAVDWNGYGLSAEQFERHAVELVNAGVDVIAAGGDAAVRAAQRATTSIPILALTDDMVGQGFVRSLARPGGNTTGVTLLASELDGKRQEILIEAVAGARRIAALVDSNTTMPSQLRMLEDAARARDVELSIHQVDWREEIGNAIDAATAADAGALNVLASALLFNNRTIIFDRVATLRLPAVYQWPEMAEQGGLIGYVPLIVQLYRDIMSRQLAKLLRGAKPADLPVEQPTRFELVVNLKTAKAIGHEVPAGLVLRADKVIE